jgi:hypothetical protein
MFVSVFLSVFFAISILFVLVYYFAFEYCRYKMAKGMADGLGGSAVFKIGGSYMRRHHEGVEERAWVVPDDKMAWGSILTMIIPSTAKLILQKNKPLGFRFYIERKAGMLLRAISLGTLKTADFNVPQLDETLQLQTNDPVEAARYFAATDKQQALMALFLAGFIQIKGGRNAITAIMTDLSDESINPDRLDHHFEQLRRF